MGSFRDVPKLPGVVMQEAESQAKSAIQDAVSRAPVFVNIKDPLSRREREVAILISQGMSNKTAAALLFVEEKTIKFHLTNIYRKLGLKSRQQLIIAEANRRAAHSLTRDL